MALLVLAPVVRTRRLRSNRRFDLVTDLGGTSPGSSLSPNYLSSRCSLIDPAVRRRWFWTSGYALLLAARMVRCGLGSSRASSQLVWLHRIIFRDPPAALMPREQAYCTRMLVFTVCFSGRVNGLSKVHYFFIEVERMTRLIVIRETSVNKHREPARVCLSQAVTTRWMPGALAPAHSSCHRCSSNSASTHHLPFATTNLLITDVGTAGCDSVF